MGSFDALLGALVLYFGAFNFLEARLPAALTEAAGEASRGAALGLFATSQFAGAFAGGLMGGVLLGSHWQVTGIFAVAAASVVAWMPWARATESPRNRADLTMRGRGFNDYNERHKTNGERPWHAASTKSS